MPQVAPPDRPAAFPPPLPSLRPRPPPPPPPFPSPSSPRQSPHPPPRPSPRLGRPRHARRRVDTRRGIGQRPRRPPWQTKGWRTRRASPSRTSARAIPPGLAVPNDLVNNFFNVDYDEVRGGGHPAPRPTPPPCTPLSPHQNLATRSIPPLPSPRHLCLSCPHRCVSVPRVSPLREPLHPARLPQGARIHPNSWGANINAYTIPTRDVDEFMALRDDMLILFAAGNSGTSTAPARSARPPRARTASPSAPPRTPTRGAAARTATSRSFSSQGPGPGGSIKPDVVAPGFPDHGSANPNDPARVRPHGDGGDVDGDADHVGQRRAAPQSAPARGGTRRAPRAARTRRCRRARS